jgi:hypothetical protein
LRQGPCSYQLRGQGGAEGEKKSKRAMGRIGGGGKRTIHGIPSGIAHDYCVSTTAGHQMARALIMRMLSYMLDALELYGREGHGSHASAAWRGE